MQTSAMLRWLSICLLIALLAACSAMPGASFGSPTATPTENPTRAACPVIEPAWVKPPQDEAVQGEPGFGYYFVNEDSSIWASAGWADDEEFELRAGGEGVKVGWFRPAGAVLEVTGQRLDGEAPAMEFHASCCYPTRFQASGLYFPTQGCWELDARAAGSELSFVVWVEPEE